MYPGYLKIPSPRYNTSGGMPAVTSGVEVTTYLDTSAINHRAMVSLVTKFILVKSISIHVNWKEVLQLFNPCFIKL